MPEMSPTMVLVFGGVLAVYLFVMYAIGFLAQRNVENVEDYVLAGRRLPVSLCAITIMATWFGAESLMTTADEVGKEGIRKAMLDPVGISLCLVLAGIFVAGPMWRMHLMTVPDFFQRRYGKSAEILSSLILVPSYFGWVAAQYVALALLMKQFFGVPYEYALIGVAVFGTGYTLMGGMWSVTWTDAIQMGFIIVGLLLMGYSLLEYLGGQAGLVAGGQRLIQEQAIERWHLTDHGEFWRDMATALAAIAIGSLGNLPMQDLMQRIFSAKSDVVARRACFVAGTGYAMMGLFPIALGMAAPLVIPEHFGEELENVVMLSAAKLFNPFFLLMFFLAIISAVLSTIVSAVMAPSAVMAQNLISPALQKIYGESLSVSTQLLLQRLCVVFVSAASVLLAFQGTGAYELVQGSYSMGLVGLFVPFVFGLHKARAPKAAAMASMLAGIGLWTLHFVCDWEFLFEPWLIEHGFAFPHELAGLLASGAAFFVTWAIVGSAEPHPVVLASRQPYVPPSIAAPEAGIVPRSEND
jgi:solute:Na+ symporter, SSS family